MPSIFTKIIRGEIPCQKILEDDHYFSFMDIKPIKTGHTLIIPKQEIDYLFDLDDDLLSGMMLFSKKVAAAIRKVVPCERIGIMVAGLEVPHAHIHLIPIDGIGDLNFAKAQPSNNDTLAELAQKIRENL